MGSHHSAAEVQKGHSVAGGLVSVPLQGGLQTTNRAALRAAIKVLRLVPETTGLQFCVESQLVTDGATPMYGKN